MGLQELGGWEVSHKESVEGTANITLNIFINLNFMKKIGFVRSGIKLPDSSRNERAEF